MSKRNVLHSLALLAALGLAVSGPLPGEASSPQRGTESRRILPHVTYTRMSPEGAARRRAALGLPSAPGSGAPSQGAQVRRAGGGVIAEPGLESSHVGVARRGPDGRLMFFCTSGKAAMETAQSSQAHAEGRDR